MESDEVTILFRVLFDMRKDLKRIADAIGGDDEEEAEDDS